LKRKLLYATVFGSANKKAFLEPVNVIQFEVCDLNASQAINRQKEEDSSRAKVMWIIA
jgi:hypothetical protein